MSAIYLSASFGRRVELNGYRADLLARGHVVTSSWLDVEAEGPETDWRAACLTDKKDIRDAEVFIAFTDGELGRGGKDWELGFVTGGCSWTQVLIVGPRVHLGHWEKSMRHFATWAEALDWMEDEPKVAE